MAAAQASTDTPVSCCGVKNNLEAGLLSAVSSTSEIGTEYGPAQSFTARA
ncbi:MAG: hypothetical protein SFW67_31065 [Myxococcaceae bacterium]|nr:hypothetical protein [Myxococcaceae bacterium]